MTESLAIFFPCCCAKAAHVSRPALYAYGDNSPMSIGILPLTQVSGLAYCAAMEQLREEILAYCSARGMGLGTFGSYAVNDGKFVKRIMQPGKQCLPSTADRVRAYIAANPVPRRKKQ